MWTCRPPYTPPRLADGTAALYAANQRYEEQQLLKGKTAARKPMPQSAALPLAALRHRCHAANGGPGPWRQDARRLVWWGAADASRVDALAARYGTHLAVSHAVSALRLAGVAEVAAGSGLLLHPHTEVKARSARVERSVRTVKGSVSLQMRRRIVSARGGV